MKINRIVYLLFSICLLVASHGWLPVAVDGESPHEGLQPSVEKRFAQPTDEVPDFQRHVTPLLGRLGCNGRACHGSFQGQGGFQLSLFGYDFASDHAAMLADGSGRVDLEEPLESLILVKPTDEDLHEGGQRYETGSWQYNLLQRWVAGGAVATGKPVRLEKLEVLPAEIILSEVNDPSQIELKVIAHWEDGSREDVTPLSRFQVNNTSIADVTPEGIVQPTQVSGDTHLVAFYDNAVAPIPVMRAVSTARGVEPVNAIEMAPTEVDSLVFQKLNKLGIRQSEVTNDVTFLRRVSLDISGTLPSPDEIRRFIANQNVDKRRHKIDQLLESKAYSAWWTTFFCDLTGNNSQQLRNLGISQDMASQQWYQWIRDKIERNIPYDEMVAGIAVATSRQPQETYLDYCNRMSELSRDRQSGGLASAQSMPYYWMRREFQDQETRAISFAHAFMGIRIQCAQCHKHPFDQWSQDDFQQFSKFFTGVSVSRTQGGSKARKEQVKQIFNDLGIDTKKVKGGQLQKALTKAVRDGQTIPFIELNVHPPRMDLKPEDRRDKTKRGKVHESAVLLGSQPLDLTEYSDVRQPVMNWLRQADNPYFAKALVNRVWAHYFGIGIVEPADDLNRANPPSNGPLLDHLAEGFVENGYDLKWLHREITNSRTYQIDWAANETNADDRRNFSRSLPRRLPAEVVFDAAKQAASSHSANQAFRNQIAGRAISIPGTNLNYGNRKGAPSSAFAMQVFGRSERLNSCDCDRSDETSLIQTVYLQNDRDIHALLGDRAGWVAEITKSQQQQAVSPADKNRMREVQKQLDRLNRMVKAKEERGDVKRAEQLRQQRRKQLAKLQELKKQGEQKKEPRVQLSPEQLVNQAYLRTLSRFPTDAEKAECIKYMSEQNSISSGLRGVLWALINTKEFVVNH
ncbi:MAG: DUF1549 domain-containing protein [Mariniblastus sp.]|nr:DUF1549 domain-containing protein [Mariniblastus sp.]